MGKSQLVIPALYQGALKVRTPWTGRKRNFLTQKSQRMKPPRVYQINITSVRITRQLVSYRFLLVSNMFVKDRLV